jgi:hypothetical protein
MSGTESQICDEDITEFRRNIIKQIETKVTVKINELDNSDLSSEDDEFEVLGN